MRVCLCVTMFVRLCVCARAPARPFSLNQADQLVSGVHAGHMMHTLAHTHSRTHILALTYSHSHTRTHSHARTLSVTAGRPWASRGPVMCSQRRCRQTSPSSSSAAAEKQQMAEAQLSSPPLLYTHFLPSSSICIFISTE